MCQVSSLSPLMAKVSLWPYYCSLCSLFLASSLPLLFLWSYVLIFGAALLSIERYSKHLSAYILTYYECMCLCAHLYIYIYICIYTHACVRAMVTVACVCLSTPARAESGSQVIRCSWRQLAASGRHFLY